MISAQKKMMNANLTMMRERIQNAIDVWKDDLAGETFDFGEADAE